MKNIWKTALGNYSRFQKASDLWASECFCQRANAKAQEFEVFQSGSSEHVFFHR
jgi:hypothetical protein